MPGNVADLARLHQAGVFGFKVFLADSGVPEFGLLDPADLDAVLAETARLGALLIVHAEDPGVLAAAPAAAGRAYAGFLASRPAAAEDTAIEGLLAAAGWHGARVHILHLASASALPLIAAARADGARVTAETCPHYLSFCAEEVPDGATEFKCCPPIRDAANREGLWAGLAEGLIGTVVSDHSPCPPGLKQRESGDFGAAWGGISSLQLGLPAVWTQARRRGHGLADVVRWMSEGTAALAGLPGKGAIAPGRDADLVAFDDTARFTVDPSRLEHRHPVTPYAGQTLTGVVPDLAARASGQRGPGRKAADEAMTDSHVNLAARRLGAGVIAASDEFFGEKENLFAASGPRSARSIVRAQGPDRGRVESRRRRAPGHDWALIRLGAPGVVHAVVVDTAHFTGNFPAECSVEACAAEGYPSAANCWPPGRRGRRSCRAARWPGTARIVSR